MSLNYITLEDKLQGDYQDVFQRAEMYSLALHIDSETREEMMMDLLDLLLSAQEEGKPVEKIIGNNIEVFCKSYFGDHLGRRQFRDFLDNMYRIAWLALIIELIDMFTSEYPAGGNPLLQISNVSGYIAGIGGSLLFSFLFTYLCKPLLFRKKRLPFAVFCLMSIAGTIAFIWGLFCLVGDHFALVPYWGILAPVVLYIVIYYTLRAISRFKDHGSIRKRKDPGEQSFLQSIDSSVSDDLPGELEKRYQKIIQKQERKGKEIISGEEYLRKLRTDVNQSKIAMPILDVILTIFILIWVIRPFFTTTVGPLFASIDAFFLLLSEIPVFLFSRSMYRANKRKEEIVDYCEKHGITLTEYVERQSQEGI